MSSSDPYIEWIERMKDKCKFFHPAMLMCGAKLWNDFDTGNPNHHLTAALNLVPDADWYLTDIEGSEGLHIVADLHQLDKTTHLRFDGINCSSVLEHVERPWIAVDSMSRALKPQGLLFIQTHHTFPLHGFPHDFYRFSVEALTTLCEDAGLNVLRSAYQFPCQIVPITDIPNWNAEAESFLNVSICAIKEQ